MAAYPTLVLNSGRVGSVQPGDTALPTPTIINVGATDEALTISGGVITITTSRVQPDTEGAAASDDLDTINGGNVGDIVIVRAADNARTVVVKHQTGNIRLSAGVDKSLTHASDVIMLVFQSDNFWHQVKFSDNAA